MAGFSWNLGPQDWLKMTNPTKPTQPITQMGTMSNFGAIAGGGGASTASPIPSTTNTNTSAANPFAVAPNSPFNVPAPVTPYVDPKKTASNTAAVTGTQPYVDPKTTASNVTAPQPVTTQPANINLAYRPPPVAQTVPNEPVNMEPAPINPVMHTVPNEPQDMTPAPIAPVVQDAPKPFTPPINTTKPGDVGPNGTSNNGLTGVNPGGPPTSEPVTTPPTPTNPITAPPDTPVTAPPKTGPSLDDNMAMYEKIAADWANGVVDDKVFRTTANRAILQMGLNNQAETDALQMRINQDPALKGQGAGAALLSMMAANHNFSADQMFGQLAQDAQQKILDLQKYGLQQGVAINQMRRENDYKKLGMLQDAGDFSGAATLAAKIADFPGVSIAPSSFSAARGRLAEDAQNLLTAGNYVGAATKLSALTGTTIDAAQLQSRDPETWKAAQRMEDKGDFAGASKIYAANGLNISADDLRAMNPFQQTTWTNTLDGIKAQAMTNPAGAEAALNMLMQNPAAAKYLGFQAGTSAHDLIQSIVTGEYQANQQMRSGLQSEINLKAKANVGFSQALVDYKAMGPAAWQGFTQDGQKMASADLEKFNAARQALGMSLVHKDAQGNVVDAQGNALMPDDFAETAAAADYTSRSAAIKQQPWQVAYENLMAPGSAMREKILAIPGGEASVKESLQMLWLGGGYKLDPETDTMVPDYTGGMPWENPNTAHIFHNWPLAEFAADGTVTGKYDMGGEVYGDKVGDTTIQKMPDDEALEDAYAKYKYNKGALDAPSWYFATAGGTRPEDKTKIPKDLTAANLTNPGTTPGTTPTDPEKDLNPDGTKKGAPGTVKATQEAFDEIVTASAGGTTEAKNALMSTIKTMAAAYASAPADGKISLSTGIGSDFDAAAERLKRKGLWNESIVSHEKTGDPLLGQSEKVYYGTKDFAYYTMYVKMLNNGMNEADARKALVALIGQDKTDIALRSETVPDKAG